jgi:hypothetical protein
MADKVDTQGMSGVSDGRCSWAKPIKTLDRLEWHKNIDGSNAFLVKVPKK